MQRNERKKADVKVFLSNVAWIRKSKGLSKRRMAELLGIGVNSLTQMENGVLPPRLSAEIVFQIRDIFGITVKDLLTKCLWE